MGQTKVIVGHNIDFDLNIIGAEFIRCGFENHFEGKLQLCTKLESVEYCALPGGRGGGFKWPNLAELHQKLFGEDFPEAHNAAADVIATARCFLEMIRLGIITAGKIGLEPELVSDFITSHPDPVRPEKITIRNFRDLASQPSATGMKTWKKSRKKLNRKKNLSEILPPTSLNRSTLHSVIFMFIPSIQSCRLRLMSKISLRKPLSSTCRPSP